MSSVWVATSRACEDGIVGGGGGAGRKAITTFSDLTSADAMRRRASGGKGSSLGSRVSWACQVLSSVGSGLIDWLGAARRPILNFLDDFFLPLPDGHASCCLFDSDTTNKYIIFSTQGSRAQHSRCGMFLWPYLRLLSISRDGILIMRFPRQYRNLLLLASRPLASSFRPTTLRNQTTDNHTAADRLTHQRVSPLSEMMYALIVTSESS